MLDIKTAQDRLETILQFYHLTVQLLLSKDDTETLKAICGPILELVYRTSTDEQYKRGTAIKDQSIEIVELLKENLDKLHFIETYGEVQQTILQKRSHRKMQQKQIVNTAEGIAMKANKRQKKTEKKKEKNKERQFTRKLQS
jgi:hypothetical protein